MVEPELLDLLPEDNPAVARNRRDMRLLNAIMGNHRWFRRTILSHLRRGDRILEIGAGDGALLRRFAREAAHGIALAGLDRCSKPPNLDSAIKWHRADLLEFEDWAHYNVVIVNHLLHQFEDDLLALLGERLRQSTRVFAANETERGRWPLFLARAACLLGLGPVSRHDAVVSVRAGFLHGELPRLLGFAGKEWKLREIGTCTGSRRLLAIRRGSGSEK